MLGYVVFVMRLAMALFIIGQSANIIAGSVTTLDTGKEQLNIKMKKTCHMNILTQGKNDRMCSMWYSS